MLHFNIQDRAERCRCPSACWRTLVYICTVLNTSPHHGPMGKLSGNPGDSTVGSYPHAQLQSYYCTAHCTGPSQVGAHESQSQTQFQLPLPFSVKLCHVRTFFDQHGGEIHTDPDFLYRGWMMADVKIAQHSNLFTYCTCILQSKRSK